MELIFAKFVFTAAAVLGPGAAVDLPFLKEITPLQAHVFSGSEVYETKIPAVCDPVAGTCTGPIFEIRQRQLLCTNPGVYTVTVRLGLIAQAPIGGKVWLVSPGGSEALLAAFNAAPGAPAYVAASLQVASAGFGSCYRVRFEANGPAEVIAEPGVSFVTVGR